MIDPKRVIRVLVVDDSAFMRHAIVKMLAAQDDILVVGTASTGEEGVALQLALRPDVITMDVEMPGIGGLEASRRIVAQRGPPIIIISSLTREGAQTTFAALEIGAVDFIPKPDSVVFDILNVRDELLDKIRFFGARGAGRRPLPIRAAAHVPLAPAASVPKSVPAAAVTAATLRGNVARCGPFECVAIGTSTGGPVALSTVLPKLPKAFPLPIVIVQHMPRGFTKPLAMRLNAASHISVVEGESGMRLTKGTAIIAPAGQQLTLRRIGGCIELRLEEDVEKSLHVPSVDIMAAAVGDMFGAGALGVILTGMGHDGVVGLGVIKKNGGYVIGQDEASAVVYGMPRAAAVAGLVDRVVALDDVARTLCEIVGVAYVAE